MIGLTPAVVCYEWVEMARRNGGTLKNCFMLTMPKLKRVFTILMF